MKKEKVLAWLWVGLCVLAIFLVVPLARTIQQFVSTHWGRSLFGWAVLVSVGLAFGAVLWVLFFRVRVRSASRLLWLAGVSGLYVYFTLKLWGSPEEAIHFLEYGLLGFFLFRALSLSIRDPSIYLAAFLLASLVGIADEILQWVVPGRFWDFRDVGLNALASGLFQVALWKGIQPRLISERPTAQSWYRVSFLLATNLILLGLCASNTPDRVAVYARRLPFLLPLLQEEPMYEFSRKHVDPSIGVFYSRLELEELVRQDRERTDHHARILKEWKDRKYDQFLSHFSPLLHPFVYEMRVHLFRRDRKEEEARRERDDAKRRRLLFIAAKENLILEKYFGQTLKASTYAWEEEKKKRVEAEGNLAAPYKSPVSRGVIHLREKTLWFLILGALGLILAATLIGAKRLTRLERNETS